MTMLFFQEKRRNERINRKPTPPHPNHPPAPTPVTPRELAHAITAQSDALKQEIRELESFIQKAPAIEEDRRRQKRDLVPPPEELISRSSQKGIGIHIDRPSRAQLDADQRFRQQQMILFIILLSALIAFLVWIVGFLESAGF